MNTTDNKTNYTFELLNKFCIENEIKLSNDYSNDKITRETRIHALCITCKTQFNKTFRMLIKYNGYCIECTKENKCNKLKVKNQERNTKIDFSKSLASHTKSKYFSDKNIDEKNKKINIHFISLGTHSKYIFNCDKCEHEFEISIAKLSIGRWCPYCCVPQHKLCGNISCEKCFEKSFASHEKSKFWSNNNENSPEYVFKLGDSKIKFNCECGHSFTSVVKNITRYDCWCPYCSIPIHKLCDNDECKLCFNSSFASDEKSQFWSNKNNIKPRSVTKSTVKIFIFDCNICNHEFERSLNSISQSSWCPYCSHNILCNDNNCKFCFENSFASHEKSKYWSNKNKLKPRELFLNNNDKFIFNCNCGHEIEKTLGSIKNTWCPYCSNPPLKLCDDINCSNCYNNSFASHEKAKFWSNTNKILPRNIFKHTASKYLFNCNKCKKEFPKTISSITGGKNGWCPHCVNKSEGKLFTQLQTVYSSLIIQFKQEWCKRITYLPFDFCIPEYKIIIELDGIQHFKQVSNWSSPEEQFDNDKYKEKCANDNEYSIIRLLQEDVYYDKYDWFKELCDAIEDIKNGDEIANIYLCKNNEYNDF